MARYAAFDPETGLVTAWFDTAVFAYPNLDTSALVEVADDVWDRRLDGQMSVVDGKLVAWVAPDPTLADRAAAARSRLAAIRYGHEIAGVRFAPSGASAASVVASDRDSQNKLLAAFVLASSNPTHWKDGTGWKMADGSFVPLTVADAVAMALTVQAHVSACFDREESLAEQIGAAATAEALDTIDLTTGWPGSS